MSIRNEEALKERANNLQANGLNGFKLVLVTLHPDSDPTEAHIDVHFHNNNEIGNILNSFTADPTVAKQIFPVSGGLRVPAGPGVGQVKVIVISGNPIDTFLTLTVTPIGDYSTYTLSINFQNMDPIFSEIDFKFRPGCFNLCAPDWEPAPEPETDPTIDYLAKDYDSFRHTMISGMMKRVPGWEPTSEADLDQVVLELFSAAADELSDYQDRVMNEAYLATARKRVSLARHSRLMDYHIHQGNQASTWLALRVANGLSLNIPKGFLAWAGSEDQSVKSNIFFMTRKSQQVHHLLNQFGLYTWSDSIPSLAAGSTTADLRLLELDAIGNLNPIIDNASAVIVQNLIRDGSIDFLIIQEILNPATGKEAGRDPAKRQLLRLIPGVQGASAMEDPLTGEWFLRVRWEEKDKLKINYCFTVNCPVPTGKVDNVSLFHGNLVEVFHGLPVETIFKEPETTLMNAIEFHFERAERWGTICRLPVGPLAYKNTPPGGELPPESTLEVEVATPGGLDPWDEVISLIHSGNSDEQGDHFIVETDEEGQSLIRFGNGINGNELPDGAIVRCSYQVGLGIEGNIGLDKITNFDKATFSDISSCWNPCDITNGRDPEPLAEIIRRVPDAYRFRQLRAVTLGDYIDRAEELEEVSRAAAMYAWTGSWRTVRIAIDPVGTTELSDEIRKKIARHLDAVRLIGEDLEIRPPRFVPLDIYVSLCVHPDYWPEDIKFILEQEFSIGFTPDGRMSFFHPDLWTFGQPLRASQIMGRIQSILGVDHVIAVTMKRWNEPTPGLYDVMEVRTNEIIQVKNDPDHMEKGFIFFDLQGGRQ